MLPAVPLALLAADGILDGLLPLLGRVGQQTHVLVQRGSEEAGAG